MQPRNPVLLGQLGLVQKECTFNVGDHVYDDVFECDGIVLQLPLESETMNRGKIQIELASEAYAIWCTWDLCAVKAAAVSTMPASSQHAAGTNLHRRCDVTTIGEASRCQTADTRWPSGRLTAVSATQGGGVHLGFFPGVFRPPRWPLALHRVRSPHLDGQKVRGRWHLPPG